VTLERREKEEGAARFLAAKKPETKRDGPEKHESIRQPGQRHREGKA